MKEGSSLIKAISLGAVALLFLFLGREGPIDAVTGVFTSDTVKQEVVENIEEISDTVDVQTYVVMQAVDGDTLRVDIDGVSESIRVLGINTPETEFSNKGAECFGSEASAYAKTLLENTSVQLTYDDTQDTRDKYNRILAYVTLPDSRDFGETMIADGYAYEYTFKGIGYKKQQVYKDAQSQAEENEVGIWEKGMCKG
ncbi:MAG: micrococcal nuclease [Acidimicrobiales bacterium]|jgi:micrococcal nuclease